MFETIGGFEQHDENSAWLRLGMVGGKFSWTPINNDYFRKINPHSNELQSFNGYQVKLLPKVSAPIYTTKQHELSYLCKVKIISLSSEFWTYLDILQFNFIFTPFPLKLGNNYSESKE